MPPSSLISSQALTLNGGEVEGAGQDDHLAPRGGRPAGDVVPHLAAACGVKAEGTGVSMVPPASGPELPGIHSLPPLRGEAQSCPDYTGPVLTGSGRRPNYSSRVLSEDGAPPEVFEQQRGVHLLETGGLTLHLTSSRGQVLHGPTH